MNLCSLGKFHCSSSKVLSSSHKLLLGHRDLVPAATSKGEKKFYFSLKKKKKKKTWLEFSLNCCLNLLDERRGRTATACPSGHSALKFPERFWNDSGLFKFWTKEWHQHDFLATCKLHKMRVWMYYFILQYLWVFVCIFFIVYIFLCYFSVLLSSALLYSVTWPSLTKTQTYWLYNKWLYKIVYIPLSKGTCKENKWVITNIEGWNFWL